MAINDPLKQYNPETGQWEGIKAGAISDGTTVVTPSDVSRHLVDDARHVAPTDRLRWNKTPIVEKVYISNANTITETGSYITGASFTGSPFSGSASDNQGYLEHIHWGNPNYALQVHTSLNAGAKRRYRLKSEVTEGVWGLWRNILDQRDYDQLFQFANDGKTGIANAVNAKGVAASTADTFATLASKIGQISTGKKWASGTVPRSSLKSFLRFVGNKYYWYINGENLGFTPSTVIINFQSNYGSPQTFYSRLIGGTTINNTVGGSGSYESVALQTGESDATATISYFGANRFSVVYAMSSTTAEHDIPTINVNWLAYE